MKKIIAIALSAVMAMSLISCTKAVKNDLQIAEDAVVKEIGTIKADVSKYVSEAETKLHEMEVAVGNEYNTIKQGLKKDVKESEAFAKDIEEKVITKTDSLIAEAKKLTIDNPKIKTLHDEYIKALEDSKAKLKKLADSIKSGVQKDYDAAKKDVDDVISKITNHKKNIKDAAK
ncbi:MAG: hypothetical protein RR088_03915 [Clostridia bacterium]